MKNPRFAIWTFVGLFVLIAQQAAQAQPPDTLDPEEIARRCIHAVGQLADRCAENNADTARRCIRRVTTLLENGEEEEAAAVARRCVRRIHAQSDECVEVIHERCRRCIRVLVDLGAEQLARRVHQACERATAKVRHSQRRAIGAIRELFGDGEDV